MNMNKCKNLLKQYGFHYLSGFLFVLGIKYFYSRAGSDELLWILAPTTGWVSILSGIPFEYEAGFGYVNHSLRYLIAPSCSGVQFMIIMTTMLIFSFSHRIKRLGWIITSVFSSYLFTILVNGFRIILAIYLPEYLNELSSTCENPYMVKLLEYQPSPKQLHTAIGIIVYFTALLIIYYIVDSVTTNSSTSLAKCLVPAFWYFLIVLGIPLINSANAASKEQYRRYALLVFTVCTGIILLYRVIHFLGNSLKTRLSKTG